MATYSNQTKNSSTISNQSITTNTSLTWAEATYPWKIAQGTWAAAKTTFLPQTKNTSTISNQTKN